jgi:hypothetical protein
MSSTATVQEYGVNQPTSVAPDTRRFMERIRDAHVESVRAGPQGPLVLFTTFLTSTVVLLYHGCQYLYRCGRKCL